MIFDFITNHNWVLPVIALSPVYISMASLFHKFKNKKLNFEESKIELRIIVVTILSTMILHWYSGDQALDEKRKIKRITCDVEVEIGGNWRQEFPPFSGDFGCFNTANNLALLQLHIINNNSEKISKFYGITDRYQFTFPSPNRTKFFVKLEMHQDEPLAGRSTPN